MGAVEADDDASVNREVLDGDDDASAPTHTHPRYPDETPSTERVTTSFRDFLKRVEDHRRLRYLKTEANFLDKVANVYIRCRALCDGVHDVAASYHGDEEALWLECRFGGWERTLFQAVLALRLRAQLHTRKRVLAEQLAALLRETHLGPDVHRFMFVVATELFLAAPDSGSRRQLVELASACTALYPHEGVYFAAWLQASAVLPTPAAMASTQTKCRTLSAVMDASEKEYYRTSPRVVLGLTRFLLAHGEHTTVLKYLESYRDLMHDTWDDFSEGFCAHFSFLEATACLRLAGSPSAASELTSEYLNRAVALICSESCFATHPTSLVYATPLLMQIKQMTGDADNVLVAESERLLAAPPAASGGTDVVTAYTYLLMLTGRGREANIFVLKCKRVSGSVTDSDFPANILPGGTGSAGEEGGLEDLGCQLFMVECLSAYLRAFHQHGELLRAGRMLKPPAACQPTGDPLITYDAFTSQLNAVHEFFSHHILWSTQQLSAPRPPSPVEDRDASSPARAPELPVGVLAAHNDTHFYVQAAQKPGAVHTYMSAIAELPAVPAQLQPHVLSPSVRRRYDEAVHSASRPHTDDFIKSHPQLYPTSPAAVEPDAPFVGPELDAALEAFADYDNHSTADNTTHDLNIEYVAKDESLPFLVEQAVEHFAVLDRSGRGRIHLRTAVITVRRYLQNSHVDGDVKHVLRLMLPYLDAGEPQWLDRDRWVRVFFGIHRT